MSANTPEHVRVHGTSHRAGGLFSVHAAAGTAVAVFNLGGTRQDIPVTQQGDTVTLDLHALPRGIYIIKVGKESFKINKNWHKN